MTVKTLERAQAIQKRRVAEGKTGIARSVRKFLMETAIQLTTHGGQVSCNTFDWYVYNELRQKVESIDPFPLRESNEND